MKHRSHKAKFGGGIDANQMLMRKLATNFFIHGKIVTTEKKAKALKSHIEILTEKTKEQNESNKNYLLSKLANVDMVNKLFAEVGPVIKDIKGGYVRILRLQQRANDGALMARMEWAYPVITVKPVEEVKKVEEVPAEKTEEAKPKRRTKKETK